MTSTPTSPWRGRSPVDYNQPYDGKSPPMILPPGVSSYGFLEWCGRSWRSLRTTSTATATTTTTTKRNNRTATTMAPHCPHKQSSRSQGSSTLSTVPVEKPTRIYSSPIIRNCRFQSRTRRNYHLHLLQVQLQFVFVFD
jgi:hypothetical protein